MTNGNWLESFLEHLSQTFEIPPEATRNIAVNDTVWALDNTAYRTAEGKWQARFDVVVFGQDTGNRVVSTVVDVAKMLNIGISDGSRQLIIERLGLLLQPALQGKIVEILFAAQKSSMLRTSPTGSSGISSDIQDLPCFHGIHTVRSVVNAPSGAKGLLEMTTFFAEPEGWGIISDIDDTIKVTQTASVVGTLRETFAAEPTPIEGMPELYKYIQDLVTESSPFFYVSASPYTLYVFLHEFCKKYFPQGTIILRDICWNNLWSQIIAGTFAYKIDQIDQIFSWLPRRKMICVGDSTQHDPEVYAQVCRKYPDWIKLILIRKGTGISTSSDEKQDNGLERFERAFHDIDNERWFVFDMPEQCRQVVKR
ncbi:hypothetical protein EPUL_003167, partial [Erysiphe pulchra]